MTTPIRVAYADPPYIGQARQHYRCPEVDHAELIERLVRDFPDGWALSCSSPSLRKLLPLCPEDVRVAAWCKTWIVFKKRVNVSYSWEPVIWRGGRKGQATEFRAQDSLVASPAMDGFVGSKPAAFSRWIFRMLGLQPGDEFVDLFYGSGAVTKAWQEWSRQGVLQEDMR